MFDFIVFILISFNVPKAKGSESSLLSRQDESRDLNPRGYGYGGLAYPFLPFLEPLSILAVLGFLAFLVQTFHAIYYNHNHNTGLVGGLLNNVLPHHKKLQPEARRNENIFKAIDLYDTFNKGIKINKRTTLGGNNVKSSKKRTRTWF